MSEPIKFFASVDQAQAGDDEIRLVLFVKDSAADLAAAVSMFTLTNRRLRVGAYLGTTLDPIAEFCAAIPQIKSGIQIRSKKPPVIRLDVPMLEATSALRLVGYSERVIRFEVADEGEQVGRNGKKQPRPKEAKEKKPYGELWRILFVDGFFQCPGVKEAREEFNEGVYFQDPRKQMRKVFGVESLGNEVGPGKIYQKFPPAQFPQVQTMVEQAKRKAGVN